MIGALMEIERRAVFDRTGKYRYSLSRVWACHRPRILFVMLNPNQADDLRDDPTIKRCTGLADALGFGSLAVVNLFAYRAKTPRLLREAKEPVGIKNDMHIRNAASQSHSIVVAWGNHGCLKERDQEVLALLSEFGSLYSFGRTKLNMPKHPLYLPGAARLEPFVY